MPAYTKDGDLISLLSFLKKEKTGQKCPTYDFTSTKHSPAFNQSGLFKINV